MTRSTILLFTCVLWLSGCATPGIPYVTPPSGDTATVDFMAMHTSMAVFFSACEEATCRSATHEIAELNPSIFRTKPVAGYEYPQEIHKDRPVRATVAAGTRFSFEARGVFRPLFCMVSGGFVPIRASHYEVTFQEIRGQCNVEVQELRDEGGTTRRVPVPIR